MFQPVIKEYTRSMSGMLKSTASVTEELLRERKRDKGHEETKMKKRRTPE